MGIKKHWNFSSLLLMCVFIFLFFNFLLFPPFPFLSLSLSMLFFLLWRSHAHSFKSKPFIKPMARCRPFSIHKHLLCTKSHISHVYMTAREKGQESGSTYRTDRQFAPRSRAYIAPLIFAHFIPPFSSACCCYCCCMGKNSSSSSSKKHKNTKHKLYIWKFVSIINVVYFALALWLETGCCDKNMNMNQTEKLIYLFSTYI